mgnify:CR=1 FL=1
MRQLWIAVAILGGMWALTAWNVTVMHQQVQPIVEELHQAAAAAREEDWPRAEALTQTIREQWQEQVPYLQMVHAHEHTDEATLSLQTLEGALASRSPGEYATAAARMAGTLEIILQPVIGMKKLPSPAPVTSSVQGRGSLWGFLILLGFPG